MILAFVLAVTSPFAFVSSEVEKPASGTGFSTSLEARSTALDAERAFAADAQILGQWTAFRKWAAPDATMFVPQPINAQAWLKERKNPPKAIAWWPTATYVSCDGSLAVNTGGWKRPDGAVGYFSTVWQRQQDGGWKWVLDHGDIAATPRPRPVFTHIRKAVCQRPFHRAELTVHDAGTSGGDIASKDGTLKIGWTVFSDRNRTIEVSMARRSKPGKFKLAVYLMPVVTDKVAAPE